MKRRNLLLAILAAPLASGWYEKDNPVAVQTDYTFIRNNDD